MTTLFAPTEAYIQPTTAATDAILMVTAFALCIALRRRGERYASTGLLLIGIAAFIGTVRFGVNPGLAELHGFVTDLATCTGLPLIAIQFAATCVGWPGRDGRMTTMGVSVVGFAAFGLAFPFPQYGFAVGVISMLVVAASALRCTIRGNTRSLASVAGALGFGIASMGLSGEMVGPVRAMDLAHLLLALSCAGLAYGLPSRTTDWE